MLTWHFPSAFTVILCHLAMNYSNSLPASNSWPREYEGGHFLITAFIYCYTVTGFYHGCSALHPWSYSPKTQWRFFTSTVENHWSAHFLQPVGGCQLQHKTFTELGHFAGLQTTVHRSHRVMFMVQGKLCHKILLEATHLQNRLLYLHIYHRGVQGFHMSQQAIGKTSLSLESRRKLTAITSRPHYPIRLQHQRV